MPPTPKPARGLGPRRWSAERSLCGQTTQQVIMAPRVVFGVHWGSKRTWIGAEHGRGSSGGTTQSALGFSRRSRVGLFGEIGL